MLDRNISLMEFFKDSMPNKKAVEMTMKFLNVDAEKITYNLILSSIAEANPAAYNLILKHPNGNAWLNKTLIDLKNLYS